MSGVVGDYNYGQILHDHAELLHLRVHSRKTSAVQDDRVDSSRRSYIGKIMVIRHSTSYMYNEERDREVFSLEQANKKDTSAVTKGKHTMSTTKVGRTIRTVQTHETRCLKKIWSIGAELGRLEVEYHMRHTLQVGHFQA